LAFCKLKEVSSKTNLTRVVCISRNTEKSKTGKNTRLKDERRREGRRNANPRL